MIIYGPEERTNALRPTWRVMIFSTLEETKYLSVRAGTQKSRVKGL
jgi:hypothetical protein